MDIASIAALGSPTASIDPSALRAGQTPQQQRAAVAQQFEAIMMRQLLKDSVGSMLGGEDSAAGGIYGYMLTDVFASKLAAGGGMGLAGMIEKQLSPTNEIKTNPAAGTSSSP